MRWEASENWSEEEAVKQHEQWLADGKPDSRSRGPYETWCGLKNLARLQLKYEAGEKGAILEAVACCALNDLEMPQWLAWGFLKAYRAVRHFEAGKWDDIFGPAHPKGTRLEARKNKRQRELLVFQYMQSILAAEPDTKIDAGLFERVGPKFGIGKTLADEYCYSVAKWLGEPMRPEKPWLVYEPGEQTPNK